MPDWAMSLLVTAGGLGLMAGGAKAWWTAWRDDRKQARDNVAAEKKSLEDRVETSRAKVESLLMDAIARERETNALRVERLEMDKKLAALVTTLTAALDRAEAHAKLRGH